MDIINELIKIRSTNPEITPLLYDVVRTLTVQIIVQFMFYINNPGTTFINSMFLQTTIFLLLGVVVFWLISYKLMSNYVFPLNLNIEENIIEEINIKE
jgi:hypothetical protein